MDKSEFLEILRQGVEVWNRWRQENLDVEISFSDIPPVSLCFVNFEGAFLFDIDFDGVDLSEANLSYVKVTGSTFRSVPDINENTTMVTRVVNGVEENWLDCNAIGTCLKKADLSYSDFSHCAFYEADLQEADLSNATFVETDFIRANLSNTVLRKTRFHRTDFSGADLRGADLTGAELLGADFSGADLTGACLSGANLSGTNLTKANLAGANLSGANLSGALLVQTDLTKANLTGCRIYGISAWDVHLEDAIQKDLTITPLKELLLPSPTLYPSATLYPGKSEITLDNLEVAQFINLLLNNQKIRDIINTITSKVVLILGRFTDERKVVLDALRDELRDHNNYLPVVFDFEKPTTRDLTETVSTLAHLARFIIIDLTDPSSAPHEAATIIPQCVVPVQPLLVQGDSRHEYTMFQDLRRRHHWVLPTYRYQDIPSLLASLKEHIIDPAELKAQELEKRM